MSERYITDSLDDYPIGPCPNCGGAIGHADLERKENWQAWSGKAEDPMPLSWTATGQLTCSICEKTRPVIANVETGSCRPVFESMRIPA